MINFKFQVKKVEFFIYSSEVWHHTWNILFLYVISQINTNIIITVVCFKMITFKEWFLYFQL